jgi:PepSY-associated TM region
LRALILLHRYLGITVGALMAMWCLSGFVMMYQSYPALDERVRLAHLSPIDFETCCTLSADLPDAASLRSLQIEQLGRAALVRWRTTDGASVITPIAPEEAASVARPFLRTDARLAPATMVDFDAWTVSGDFNADRPLYRFDLGDAPGTQLYVSGTTGQAVQLTTRSQRIWNWFGAIPHWLYFTPLRHRPVLWNWIVIVTSCAGVFLAAIGLWIGWVRWRHRVSGRWSPYRGFNLWHHLAGLVFGVLAFTWILSGLLSMNPMGLLEGSGMQPERQALSGDPVNIGQARAALRALSDLRPAGVVAVRFAPLAGAAFFEVTRSDGERQRVDGQGRAAPLTPAELSFIGSQLGGTGDARPILMQQEDRYHFSHHRAAAELPVYRLIVPGTGIYYYIDPVTGALLGRFDRGAKGYRWWHQGLHRLDFTPALRQRPLWDLLMLTALSGVTLLCVTGAWLGVRRLSGRQA